MSTLNNALRKLTACLVVGGAALVASAQAFELTGTGEYLKASDKLLVNGRYISVSSGGVGLTASDQFLDSHLTLSATLLAARTGSASATFSGANVAGPASLTTQKLDARLYLQPTRELSPFVHVGTVHRSGDTDFTGLRGSSPVSGSAVIHYDHTSTALGLRWRLSPQTTAEASTGKYSWSLNSDANGKVGSIRATTTIAANARDSFSTLGWRYQGAAWHFSGKYSLFKMTSDNSITSRGIEANAGYAF